MVELLSQFRSIDIVSYVGVEDFADRLNFLFTPSLLGALCTIVTVRTYFLHPISCYVPNQLGSGSDGGQISFVNNYCWTEGTYAVKPKDFLIDNSLEDGGLSRYKSQKIVYYQWIPFVLGMQAVLFCLPRLLWHMFSYDRAGTDVAHIVKIAKDAAHEAGENREKLVSHACRMLQQMLNRNMTTKATCGPPGSVGHMCCKCIAVLIPSRLVGSWLIVTYFFVKLAYLGNALGQLALMQGFLQLNTSKYRLLGVHLLAEVAEGEDWQNTMVFPRVGCCAVYMRAASKGNFLFSQCSLPVNMINEKIYIFLWFWIIFVAVGTGISMLMWSLRIFNSGIKGTFVTKYLKVADNYSKLRKNPYFIKFVRRYLRHDGTFVLKMIALNCGDIICSEMIQRLWSHFKVTCVQCPSGEDGAAAELRQSPHCRAHASVLHLSCNNLPEIVQRPKRNKRQLHHLVRRRTSAPPVSEVPGGQKLEEIDELLEELTSAKDSHTQHQQQQQQQKKKRGKDDDEVFDA